MTKRIIVTGAAGGIGLETLPMLAGDDVHLLLVDLPDRTRLLDDIAARLPGTSRIVASAIDSFEACRNVVAEAGGPISGLVHLAGLFEPDPEGPADHGVWDRAILHNLTNAYDMAGACVEAIDTSRTAQFVFISSLAFRRGSYEHVPYAAAKGGLVGMVRALSKRHAPKILVNGLAPGLIDTRMPADIIAKRKEQLLSAIPLKRFGHPREVASVITFLMSEASSYMTGQILNVDGGIVNG